MNVVLYQPEIPQNTGNIARTCAITETTLHLIRPLGFSLSDKYLKRAGLDYWEDLDLHLYNSLDELIEKYSDNSIYFITTKGKQTYSNIKFNKDDFLIFGRETAGLPPELLEKNKKFTLRIPMRTGKRSLNLSNSVAIVLYEGLRQNNFYFVK